MKRERLLADFLDLDAKLVRAGFPATSRWWKSTITRFLRSKARRLVVRVGRRGGKSSTLCRLAVALAVFVQWPVPPGDVGVVAFVSTRKDEAAARLHTIRTILTTLGIPFEPCTDGGVQLVDAPIRFVVFPATVAGVSGFTSIVVMADEVAKWRDSDSGSNPAKEVLAALRPTMATQPDALEFLASSPLGTSDAHAKAFSAGDSDYQVTAHAPTWVANETITEAATHALEPDIRTWSREYAAIPQAGVLGAFDGDAIALAFDTERTYVRDCRRVVVTDPSSGRSDAWTWGTVGWSIAPSGVRVLAFDEIQAVEGRFWDLGIQGDAIVDAITETANAAGVTAVHGDQRESLMLTSAFKRRHIAYRVHDWTNESKVDAVAFVRRLLAENRLALPKCEPLREELLNFEERITPSGAITFAGRGKNHDDYVALLITAGIADAAFELPHDAAGTKRIRTGGTRADFVSAQLRTGKGW